MRMSGEKKEERWKVRVPAKVALTEINEYLMCQLCIGYLIDATAIIECQHTFCKSCILKYLETNSYCPICEVQLNIAKPLLSLRSDENLQKLVYKLVPGLVNSEIERRKDFGLKLDSDDPSDDSGVDGLKEAEELCFLAPEDNVTLSLEYFKSEECEGDREEPKSEDASSQKTKTEAGNKKSPSSTGTASNPEDKANDRRYLQCPAAVSVGILKKFIRQKYGLSDDYRVDLLYNGNSENNLENELTLLDLSFIYKWKKAEPMCFHYRIFDRPTKSLSERPAVKRTAPSVLDEPPPDDAPPSAGPHQNHSNSPGSSSSSTKHPRLGGASSPSSGSTKMSSDGKDSKGQTTAITPFQGKEQTGSSSMSAALRGKVTPSREEDAEVSTGSCSSPAYSPHGSGYESLSPTAKNSSSLATPTTSSSSPESPASPLKISIKAEGKTHRHRHRHHKEKHKRKSKSKSKSKDREKSKEKERYKYNAHPNPSQSQTISVKPSGKHRHRHHHKNRDKEQVVSASEKASTTQVSSTSTSSIINPAEKTPQNSTPQPIQGQQRSRTSSVASIGSGGLEGRSRSSGIELTPIPIPSTKSNSTIQQSQSPVIGKQNIKIPDSLQLQVPKSVTLIPVTPGSKGLSSRNAGNDKAQCPRLNSSQTFTHPITNKSLHQITVTEVPPPNAKGPLPIVNSSSTTTNNVITIEKCSPNPPSHAVTAPKQLFNGPGSMEITKIYCDTTSGPTTVPNPVMQAAVPKSKVHSNSGIFETHSQGKKLKGLDISITPTPPSYGKALAPAPRKVEEPSNFVPKGNVAGLPKIPGVSILPQAIHNANKEQQRKFNSGLMSFSCTKINPESNNNSNGKLNSSTGGRLLSLPVHHKPTEKQRSPSPAVALNGKQSSGRTPPRKCSADSVYENSRGSSPSNYNQSRKMSLPISIVNSSCTAFSSSGVHIPHEREALNTTTKQRDTGTNIQNHSTKGHKRSFESTLSIPCNLGGLASKKARVEQSQSQNSTPPVEKKKLEGGESLPLDLSGRSSRLTPPGNEIAGILHPASPIPVHVPTIGTSCQSQPSPKLMHNKNQSTPSIDSIVENLTQKHQRGNMQHRVDRSSSTSSKESMSPPNTCSSPPMSHPPTYHHDLLTLSNAAATARKLSHQQKQSGTAMSNLLAAANSMAYNSPNQSSNSLARPHNSAPPMSPGSAAAAASLMLPGLLQQLGHHHQLSSMMLSPPGGLTGQGIKTSMLSQGNMYAGFPGINGRMTSFGHSMGLPSVSPLSPPFYNSRGSSASASTLKIPNLSNSNSKSRSKSPTSTPQLVPDNESLQSHNKGAKSPKTNGSSPPRVTSPPEKIKPNTGGGGGSFSFGISNFLKDTHGKSGVDPNAKAIVTSSSAGLLGQRQQNHKSLSTKPSQNENSKVKGEGPISSLPKPQKSPSPPKEQSLPVSKLLGFESPGSTLSASTTETVQKLSLEIETETEIKTREEPRRNSRLGDLGLALGLVPCTPPMALSSAEAATVTTVSIPTLSVSPPNLIKPFAIPSLLPSTKETGSPSMIIPATTQQQNQAVRQIPNPSLLSSRQNSVNNNNSGVNNGDARAWKSVMDKGEPTVSHPKPQEPQSIHLDMKLWIERHESQKTQARTLPCPKDTTNNAETQVEDSKPVKGDESPQVTFSASVPSPPANVGTQHSPTFKSDFHTQIETSQGPENPVRQDETFGKQCVLLESPKEELSKKLAHQRQDVLKPHDSVASVGNDISNVVDVESNHLFYEEPPRELPDYLSLIEPVVKGPEEKDKCESGSFELSVAIASSEFGTEVKSLEPLDDVKIKNVAEGSIVVDFQRDLTKELLMNESGFNLNPSAERGLLETVVAVNPDSGFGDEKCDSPALVIDEDEEKDVRGKQEGEADNESEETGGQEERPLEVPTPIVNGTLSNTPNECELLKDRDMESEGSGSNSNGKLDELKEIKEEDPPLRRPLSPLPRALPDGSLSPTALIGSQCPLPKASGTIGPSETEVEAGAVKGLEVDKITAGLLASAASLNNNNNVSPRSESPTGTIPVTQINPPPSNQTPPPHPAVTNV